MKFLKFFLILVVLSPIIAEAQIKQPQPRCARGPFDDADYNGIVDKHEGTGCPGDAHLVTEGTGYAEHIDDGDLAGTMVSFTSASADSGTAARIPQGSGPVSGQVRLRTPSLPAGTYTVWIRARIPVSGKDRIWLSTAPHSRLPPPTSAQRTRACDQAGLCSGGVLLNYDWVKLSPTVNGGAARDLYITADNSVELNCIYIDTSSLAVPACPPDASPPVVDYVILDTSSTPASVSDSQWNGANILPWGGLNTGVTVTHTVKLLWNDTANKLCMLGQIPAAGLQTTTTADDDATTGVNETSFRMDFRLDTESTIDSALYRIIANGAATPAVLDGNYPTTTFSSTLDFSNVAKSRTYTSDILLVQICFDLPSTVTAETIASLEFFSTETIAGVTKYRVAGSPTGGTLDFPNWLTVRFEGDAVGGADTTAPAVGQPKLVSNSGDSQTWSYTCTDAGSGCFTGLLDYDSDSGASYCNASPGTGTCPQVCTLSGTAASGTFNCTITGLNQGTTYYVRGRAKDGSGNETSGTENNDTTTSTGLVFYAAPTPTGSGSNNGLTQSTPFRIGDFWSHAEPGSILYLLDGTYTLSNSAGSNDSVINVPTSVNGTAAERITIKCLNDGQCNMDGQGVYQPIFVAGSNYITFEGMDAYNSGYEVISTGGGTGFTLRRVIAWDAAPSSTAGQKEIIAPFHATNILFEDVATFGEGDGGLQLYGGRQTGPKGVVRRYWGMYGGSNYANAPDEVIHMGYDSTKQIVENAIVTWDATATQGTGPQGQIEGDRQLIIMGVDGQEHRLLGSIGYLFNGAGNMSRGIEEWFSNQYDTAQSSALIQDVVMYFEGNSTVVPYNILEIEGPCGSPGMPVCYFRNNTEIGGGASSFASSWTYQNNVDVASISALNAANANIWNGSSSNGARVCYRYVDGVLTNTPLWPWPMDSRIRAALTKSGRNPNTVFGGTGYGVTEKMEAIFGTIPAQCRSS